MVIAVHIAGLIDRFPEQRIPQQVAVAVTVFGEFHRPVAAFAAVGDVFIQLFFIDKTKYRRIVAPGLPRRRYLRRNFEAVVIAFGSHLLVGAKAGKRLLGLPFFTVNSMAPSAVLCALSRVAPYSGTPLPLWSRLRSHQS